MAERCDFYSDEEYEFALATEENEQRSYDAQREYRPMLIDKSQKIEYHKPEDDSV